MQVNVQGDFGAKIVALLRRLIWLKEHEPEIKSLVSNCSFALAFRYIPMLGLDRRKALLRRLASHFTIEESGNTLHWYAATLL